ncbi:MAG: M48 family metalloprotease [Ignavibacteriaceae bacterium]|nr:M48 family metalloprotease [Ignavibacteria bacterium]NNJ52518.1 M48 family metalloprotease [Ignavibacteriaceae bacterium]NNL21963.1 M48 family metalloprotease [Ignavibacteriaceae bacterium]
MMNHLKKILIVTFIFSATFLESCDTLESINIFSTQDDVELGRQLDLEIRSNPSEYPIYNGDPMVKRYIGTRIFNHVLASSKVENREIFNYQIEIIDKPDVLNAFAIPGGYIYLYTGLLLYLNSEAALAGVIAHEIAHVEERHSTQRLTKYYGISILLGIVLGENPSTIAEIAANLFVGLAFLANSRNDEEEADDNSYKYLKDTRYYPGGVKFFFEKLQFDGLIDSSSSKIETFLSTHPDPIERINNINQMLLQDGIGVKDFQSNDPDMYRDDYFTYIKNKL